MSVSSTNIRKDLLNSEIKPKQFNYQTYKKQASVKYDHLSKDISKKLNECCVLNFIRSSERKGTAKTAMSDTEMDYDLCMINKYDENLNTSLSFISEFDLEEDVKENNSSFESCDNDISIEQIKIVKNIKNCKRSSIQEDIENEDQLENDWKDIQELLLKKNLS
jgi:hypothetical protein